MKSSGLEARNNIQSGIRKGHSHDLGTLAVIGQSERGVERAANAALHGYTVIAFDDAVRIAQLSSELAPGNIRYTSDPAAIRGIDIYVITTALRERADRRLDTKDLSHAIETIGHAVAYGALVIIETDTIPGLSESMHPLLLRASRTQRGEIDLAYATPQSEHGMRAVGGATSRAASRALACYRSLGEHNVHGVSSMREAEAVRFVQNAYADINAALANELAVGFDRSGIDTTRVIDLAAEGGRPLPHPGLFRASRVPVDPYEFIRRGRKNGAEDRLLGSASRALASMPFFIVRVLADALRYKKRSLKRSEVAILGSASASEKNIMITALQKRGAAVRTYDPYEPSLSNVRSIEDALDGAHAILVISDDDMYRQMSADDLEHAGIKVVVDAANCLDSAAFNNGILYRGLGR